ncbi:probable diacyglycerol O-acyltransferase tgs1 [Palaemon carinicauda]|uniref:probable diacyglycerol O-acyltransferase tgs1 n=1 Tax=Palaemon carinicauda TaxID=392227 RepID=UPI0035B59312
MESISYPLERHDFSWLMVNYTKTANASSNFPFILSSSSFREALQTKSDDLGWLFNFSFGDVCLGFLSLVVIRNLYKDIHINFSRKNVVSKKWDLQIFDFILTNVIKTITGVVLLAISLPVALPVTFLFWLLSTLAKAVYAFQFKGSVSKAQGMDGLWGLETKESRPFILVCLRLSGVPDVGKISHHISSRILDVQDNSGQYKFRKFRQTFSQLYGYYIWRDAKSFDIAEHIRLIDLREYYQQMLEEVNGRSGLKETIKEPVEVADTMLSQFLSEEGTAALSSDRPPWEVMLLTRGDGSYNVIIKVHHAIGDGISLMRVCVETLIDSPLDSLPVKPKKENPLFRAAVGLWSALLLPFGLIQIIANFDNNSMHGGQLSGKKVMACSRGIPLAVLKSVKLAAGTTVNDVLMSCLSASLSKHFSRRAEVIDQITAVVPVSFHDLNAPLVVSNQFSCATVKLPVSQEHSPEERLKVTKSLLDGMKRDPTLLAVYKMMRAVSEVLPAPVAELLLAGGGISLAASNVPGPQQEISVWGDKVEDLLFWVPNRAPVGVGFSFVSYMGFVNIGLNVDATIVNSVEEAQQLLDGIEAEAYHLHKKYVQIN